MKNINSIVASDELHGRYGLYNNCIGFIQLFAWDESYRFLNIETGKIQKIKIQNISKVKLIESDEFKTIYNQKNYPENIFRDKVFIGDSSNFTNREITYGLLHDKYIKHALYNSTNKYWTHDFCRAAAFIIAEYHLCVEMIKEFGSLKAAKNGGEKMAGLVEKYLIGINSMYSKKCQELGVGGGECKITEENLATQLKKVKELPSEYYNFIFDTKVVKSEMKIINYYLNYTNK